MPDQLTYVGHATVSIELSGTRLLTDPVLRDRFLHVRRHTSTPETGGLAEINLVLVSHLHPDHLDLPSLRYLDPDTEFVVPVGGGRLIRGRGFRRVTEVASGDSVQVGGVEVTVTPAIHDGRRWPIGRPRKAVGYDIRGPGTRVYFAGDTDLFAGMRELAGGLDVALLPIGGWGPHVGSGHLDPHRAAEAAVMLKPRVVVPIHWGTFLRAGLSTTRPNLLTDPPAKLIAEVAAVAPSVEVRVLEPGESLALPLS